MKTIRGIILLLVAGAAIAASCLYLIERGEKNERDWRLSSRRFEQMDFKPGAGR